MFMRIFISCLLTTIIMILGTYSQQHISDKAPQSQFAENNSTTLYPVQPISTWTNVGYALNAGVAFAHATKYPIAYSFPYIIVGVWAMLVSIFSSLFHASAGYGDTGNLDVSSILPYIVSIVWFEISTMVVISQGYYNRMRNIRYPNFEARKSPCGQCTGIILNSIIVIGTTGLFFMEYDKVINVPWTTKLVIFGTSILILFILGVTIVFYSVYKGYVRRRLITILYKQHLMFIGLMIGLIVAFIVIGLTFENCEHGFISHLSTSTAISIVLIYSAVVYDNIILF